MLGFFFANQQRIDGIIQGEGVKGNIDQFIEKFEKIESNIYDQMSSEMKLALMQLEKVVKESFAEYITPDEPQGHSAHLASFKKSSQRAQDQNGHQDFQ